MQILRQFGTAILTSLVSIALVIGGLSLALSEGRGSVPTSAFVPLTATFSPTETPQLLIPSPTFTTFPATPTNAFPANPTSISAGLPTSTQGAAGGASGTCGPPFNWVKNYTVQAGDTLYRIAINYYTTTADLQRANCKGASTAINVGELLWVPNVAPRTPPVTVIPSFPSSTPLPTEPLTETALPFTSTPDPTGTPTPSNTPVAPES
jgi:LysM repeat protein